MPESSSQHRPVRPSRSRRRGQQATDTGNARVPFAAIRLDQVQRLLDELLPMEHPADAVLSRWMRANPKAGARDRAEVADSAFDVLRHLRRYRHLAQSGSGPETRRLAILGLASVLDRSKLDSALSQAEQEWLGQVLNIDPATMPRAIRHSVPDWLDQYVDQLTEPESLLVSLNQPASLDLRINPWVTTRDAVLTQFLEGPEAAHSPEVTPYSPWGIRLQGRPPVNRWPLFKSGHIEVQDEGSQILAALVAPRRGEMIIDFCAGAGGKTLLLGALMRSTGRLYAFDVSAARLARAKPRFARSGLSNIVPVVISPENDKRVKRLAGKAARVLVDAPCTGLGTLRRNPDLKWRMGPESMESLVKDQAKILEQAARCVAPGGRLVYATCSVLPQENQHQVERFIAANPAFSLVDAGTVLADRCPSLTLADSYLVLRPDRHGSDGFFAAVMQRN